MKSAPCIPIFSVKFGNAIPKSETPQSAMAPCRRMLDVGPGGNHWGSPSHGSRNWACFVQYHHFMMHFEPYPYQIQYQQCQRVPMLDDFGGPFWTPGPIPVASRVQENDSGTTIVTTCFEGQVHPPNGRLKTLLPFCSHQNSWSMDVHPVQPSQIWEIYM